MVLKPASILHSFPSWICRKQHKCIYGYVNEHWKGLSRKYFFPTSPEETVLGNFWENVAKNDAHE